MRLKKLGVAWIIFFLVVILSVIFLLALPIYISAILFGAIFLPIMIYILISKWIKRWFASAIFTFSIWLNIIIIIIPVILAAAALDLSDFAQELEENQKFIALMDNGDIVFATEVESFEIDLENLVSGTNSQVLNQERLHSLKTEIQTNNLDGKVIFVIDKEVFRDLKDLTIPSLDVTINKQQAFGIIESEDVKNYLQEELGISPRLIEKDFNPDQAKITALTLLVQEALEKHGPEYLIKELKNKNIQIYPKRLSIELIIRLVPEGIITETGLLPELPTSSRGLTRETLDENSKSLTNDAMSKEIGIENIPQGDIEEFLEVFSQQ